MGSNPEQRPEATFVNLTRRAWKNDMAGLFEAAEAVEGMIASPGWAHIVRLVELEVSGIDRMLDGQLLTRSEYARGHGRRSAYHGFMEAAHAIVAESARLRAEQERKHEGAAESASGA